MVEIDDVKADDEAEGRAGKEDGEVVMFEVC